MSCRHKQKDRHEIVINKRETEREERFLGNVGLLVRIGLNQTAAPVQELPKRKRCGSKGSVWVSEGRGQGRRGVGSGEVVCLILRFRSL